MTQPTPSGVLSRPPFGSLKFKASGDFHRELCRRVDGYFESTGQTPRDCPQMYRKTAVIVGWTVASYLLLLIFADSWWLGLPLAMSLGVAMAAIGFNVQHDGRIAPIHGGGG